MPLPRLYFFSIIFDSGYCIESRVAMCSLRVRMSIPRISEYPALAPMNIVNIKSETQIFSGGILLNKPSSRPSTAPTSGKIGKIIKNVRCSANSVQRKSGTQRPMSMPNNELSSRFCIIHRWENGFIVSRLLTDRIIPISYFISILPIFVESIRRSPRIVQLNSSSTYNCRGNIVTILYKEIVIFD